MRFATVESGFCNFLLTPEPLEFKTEFLSLDCANTLVVGDPKHMIDKNYHDVELSSLNLDDSKPLTGDAAEELLAGAAADSEQQAIEAFLKFLEAESLEPAADISLNEPDDLLDEPINGWPDYPFL